MAPRYVKSLNIYVKYAYMKLTGVLQSNRPVLRDFASAPIPGLTLDEAHAMGGCPGGVVLGVQKTERPRRSQNPPGERPPLPVPLDLVGARGEPGTEAAPSEVAEVEEEEEEGRSDVHSSEPPTR
ncbi:hypothetical protein Z517_09865 [Fonsecaea pedrosoi CBS 271.37]|uniref:Uncharacterized protein n=1 Tax=Fonsecaea pedrosoi CBS 271.37 TaxID=1442368 RepID=A0A0D2GYG9_9EURO|nr:uncharacterized protein Z517_09865 [Fonsecaea pedrosoi CBS 271.37]KIW77419.1 hypothetical protein Z517_09865 [Fonsecaea pedrosoi CBS 271.37]